MVVTAAELVKRLPDLPDGTVAALRAWLAERPHLPPIADEQLIWFAHSCYYDLDRTKACVECFYMLRSNTPEFFGNRDITRPELKSALTVLDYAAFPVKTPEGYQVIFHRLNQFEPSKYVFADGVKLLTMTMESIQATEGVIPGYLILFDMNGVRLGHLARLSIGLLRKFFQFIQEGNPIRLKQIHVINTLPILDKIMTLIRPFIKKELLSLVSWHRSRNGTGTSSSTPQRRENIPMEQKLEQVRRKHGNNRLHFYKAEELESLYAFIPKECLPSDFGGELGPVSEHHAQNTERLLSLKQYWEDEETQRLDESKKPSKNKNKKVEKTLDIRKLDLD